MFKKKDANILLFITFSISEHRDNIIRQMLSFLNQY